jgi:hypothetical protein
MVSRKELDHNAELIQHVPLGLPVQRLTLRLKLPPNLRRMV